MRQLKGIQNEINRVLVTIEAQHIVRRPVTVIQIGKYPVWLDNVNRCSYIRHIDSYSTLMKLNCLIPADCTEARLEKLMNLK